MRACVEVCDYVRRGAEVFWIEEQQVPFIVLGDQWVAFDDDHSLTNKVREHVVYGRECINSFRSSRCSHRHMKLRSDYARMQFALVRMGGLGRLESLALAKWAGWSAVQVGRHVKCLSRSNYLPS